MTALEFSIQCPFDPQLETWLELIFLKSRLISLTKVGSWTRDAGSHLNLELNHSTGRIRRNLSAYIHPIVTFLDGIILAWNDEGDDKDIMAVKALDWIFRQRLNETEVQR